MSRNKLSGVVVMFSVAERLKITDMFVRKTKALSHASATEEATLLCSCHDNTGYIRRHIRRKIIYSMSYISE